MAKALLGHVGGPDPRMLSETRQLRRRVRDLEVQPARMQQEHDVLAAAAGRHTKSGGPVMATLDHETTGPFGIKIFLSERTVVSAAADKGRSGCDSDQVEPGDPMSRRAARCQTTG